MPLTNSNPTQMGPMPPHWTKIFSRLKKYLPLYDYVMLSDADCWVKDMTRSLESFLHVFAASGVDFHVMVPTDIRKAFRLSLPLDVGLQAAGFSNFVVLLR